MRTSIIGRMQWREVGWRLLLLTVSVTLTTLLAEAALRRTFSWLYPVPSAYSRSVGVPENSLDRKMAAVSPKTRIVFIGDSFTETGEDVGPVGSGWGHLLQENTLGEVRLIGFSATGPAQYLRILDGLRLHGYSGSVVLVLYLGNDFYEQALWDRLNLSSPFADASVWPLYRQSIRPAPSGVPSFPSPCWVAGSSGTRRRDVKGLTPEVLKRTALYRAYLIARNAMTNWFKGPEGVRSNLASFLRQSCLGPGSREIRGRLFFEETRPPELVSFVRSGGASVIQLLRQRKQDLNLMIAIVRTREDICKSFHGFSVTSYDDEVKAVKAIGLPVLDPSPVFSAACLKNELYLPDGHWNAAGHALFAEAMSHLIAVTRLVNQTE